MIAYFKRFMTAIAITLIIVYALLYLKVQRDIEHRKQLCRSLPIKVRLQNRKLCPKVWDKEFTQVKK